MIIYRTVNLANDKFYVGKHNTSSDDGYLGSGLLLNRAIKKYGIGNFQREILEHCTSANINDREKFWIAELSACQFGYNIAEGGQGGKTRDWTEEERIDIQKRFIDMWANADDEFRKNHSTKISKSRTGMKLSKTNKENIGKSCKEFWDNHPDLKKSRRRKYTGSGNPNSRYKYIVSRNGLRVLETYSLKEFCDRNKFPLSYVKYCVRKDGKYKNYQIERLLI